MLRNTVNMVSLYAAFPEKVAELQFFLEQVVGPSLKKAGCLSYELRKGLSKNNEFNILEVWEGSVTFERVRLAHLQEGLDVLGEFVAVGPDMRR